MRVRPPLSGLGWCPKFSQNEFFPILFCSLFHRQQPLPPDYPIPCLFFKEVGATEICKACSSLLSPPFSRQSLPALQSPLITRPTQVPSSRTLRAPSAPHRPCFQPNPSTFSPVLRFGEVKMTPLSPPPTCFFFSRVPLPSVVLRTPAK